MSAVPVNVRVEQLDRYGAELEAAVYFCCLEAVQNAAKHAGATHVDVVLDAREGALEFCVADDGRGFDTVGGDESAGSGLANMRDRIVAVGGTLAVRSQAGAGTRVEGRIPLQRRDGEPA
jgi:signal transduction histidine kinase